MRKRSRELQGFISRFSANKAKSQAGHRPAASLLDKLTVEEMPASLPPLSLCRASRRSREAGKDILFVDGRLEDHRRREAAGQGLVHRQPRRQDRFCRRERSRADDHVQASSWASWSRMRARVKWGVYHVAELLPQGQQRVFRRPRRDACRLAAPVLRKEADDVYLRGFLGPDAVLRRGCVQIR